MELAVSECNESRTTTQEGLLFERALKRNGRKRLGARSQLGQHIRSAKSLGSVFCNESRFFRSMIHTEKSVSRSISSLFEFHSVKHRHSETV